jgi:RND family efflux transporter MFP subunit
MTPPSVKLAIATLLLLGLAGCAGSSSQGDPPQGGGGGGAMAMPVTWQTVTRQNVADSTQFMARINSKHATTIRPQVASRVVRVLVNDGQAVRAGQALYQLDNSQQAATVSSLVAGQQASVLQPSLIQKTIQAQQADLKAMQNDLAFSHKQLARYQALLADKTVSLKDTEQLATTVRNQEQKIKAITANISALGISRAEALASVAQSNATVTGAKANLAYYTVKAPFSGTIGALVAKIGDVVDPSTALTTLTDNHMLEVEVAIPADKIAKIHTGSPLQLLSTTDDPLGQAVVSAISPTLDATTQTVLVKAKVTASSQPLTMDQRLKVSVLWDKQAAVVIPLVAVFRVDGQPFVYLAKADSKSQSKAGSAPPSYSATMQAITLGPIVGDNVLVSQGLTTGQLVITGGIQKLQQGVPVMQLPPAKAVTKG